MSETSAVGYGHFPPKPVRSAHEFGAIMGGQDTLISRFRAMRGQKRGERAAPSGSRLERHLVTAPAFLMPNVFLCNQRASENAEKRASCRSMRRSIAREIHAALVAPRRSSSLLRRRWCDSHANVRSTTHRRGRTWKPGGGR